MLTKNSNQSEVKAAVETFFKPDLTLEYDKDKQSYFCRELTKWNRFFQICKAEKIKTNQNSFPAAQIDKFLNSPLRINLFPCVETSGEPDTE